MTDRRHIALGAQENSITDALPVTGRRRPAQDEPWFRNSSLRLGY
jgi:hypothetical protein